MSKLVTTQVHDWNPPIFNIRTRDTDIDIHTDGNVEVLQDGCGGWQCCSSHTTYFELSKEDAIILRDFLDRYIING